MGKWASTFHWKKFVASTAMVWQIASITAAEGAKLAFIRLLACVWSHVGLQVALVGWSKWAEVAAVRFLSCVNTDVLNKSCCAPGGIVAVATFKLPIIGPLKTIYQDPWAVLQWHVHWGMIKSILTTVWWQLVCLLDATDRAWYHVYMLSLLAQILLEILHKVKCVRLFLTHWHKVMQPSSYFLEISNVSWINVTSCVWLVGNGSFVAIHSQRQDDIGNVIDKQ